MRRMILDVFHPITWRSVALPRCQVSPFAGACQCNGTRLSDETLGGGTSARVIPGWRHAQVCPVLDLVPPPNWRTSCPLSSSHPCSPSPSDDPPGFHVPHVRNDHPAERLRLSRTTVGGVVWVVKPGRLPVDYQISCVTLLDGVRRPCGSRVVPGESSPTPHGFGHAFQIGSNRVGVRLVRRHDGQPRAVGHVHAESFDSGQSRLRGSGLRPGDLR